MGVGEWDEGDIEGKSQAQSFTERQTGKRDRRREKGVRPFLQQHLDGPRGYSLRASS